MKIQTVKTLNFHPRDFAFRLEPMNVIVGDTFSGKTAVAQAIQVGMLGYLPSLGKENTATMMLSSNPKELFVKLTFDDSRTNQLAISQEPDGGYRKTAELQVSFPAPLMDVNEYLLKSGKERIAYIISRADPAHFGYDETAMLAEMKSVPALPENDRLDDAVESVKSVIAQSVKQRKEVMATTAEWMESLRLRLENGLRSVKSSIKTQEAIIKGMRAENEPADASTELKAATEAWEKAVETRAQFGAGINRQAYKLEAELSALTDKVSAAQRRRQGAEEESVKMSNRASCPICLAKGKGWQKEWLDKQKEIIAQLDAEIAAANSEVDKAAKAIQALRKRANASAENKAIEEVARTEKEKREWERAQAQYHAYQEGQKRAEESKALLELGQAELHAFKHALTKMTEHQARLSDSAVKQLLAVANQFVEGLLKSPLCVKEGEIGRYEGKSTWVAHEVFSGTEKLIAYAGLQIALSQESPVKLVILDEMGRMTREMKGKVTARMKKLIASGTIDQCVLIDVESQPYTKDVKNIICIG
jgi:hypothetical protein